MPRLGRAGPPPEWRSAGSPGSLPLLPPFLPVLLEVEHHIGVAYLSKPSRRATS